MAKIFRGWVRAGKAVERVVSSDDGGSATTRRRLLDPRIQQTLVVVGAEMLRRNSYSTTKLRVNLLSLLFQIGCVRKKNLCSHIIDIWGVVCVALDSRFTVRFKSGCASLFTSKFHGVRF